MSLAVFTCRECGGHKTKVFQGETYLVDGLNYDKGNGTLVTFYLMQDRKYEKYLTCVNCPDISYKLPDQLEAMLSSGTLVIEELNDCMGKQLKKN